MLKIMEEKEELVSKLFSDTEAKLKKILNDEFKEFDAVTVTSHAFHVMLELEKEGKSVKFHLASKRYDGKIKNNSIDQKQHKKGLYFRRSGRSVQDFSEKEFKEIQMRLQSLYEK